MVSGKSKNLNPCDALRKQNRKKEIKRNKRDRATKREETWGTRDSSGIKNQIEDLQDLEKRGALDIMGKQRLKYLDDQYKAIEKAKKAHGEKAAIALASKAQDDKIKVTGLSAITGRDYAKEKAQAAALEAVERAEQGHNTDSPYYHPVHNPSGAAPVTQARSVLEIAAAPVARSAPPGPPPTAVASQPPGPPPGAPPGPPPGAPPGLPPGAPPGPPPGAPPDSAKVGAPPGPPPGAPPGPPPGAPPGVMVAQGPPGAPPGPPPGLPPGPRAGAPPGRTAMTTGGLVAPGPPPGPPPGHPAGNTQDAVSTMANRSAVPPGAPPGPPPGAPPGPPPGRAAVSSANTVAAPQDSDGEEEDASAGGALGALVGAYDDDEPEAKPQATHYMNPERMAQLHSMANKPQVTRAPQVTAAPQVRYRGPTGANADRQATVRAPIIEKKTLAEVNLDSAMTRMVPAAVQRRRPAPNTKKRLAPWPVAKPGSGTVARPTVAKPADDDYASFMDEINGL